MVICVCYFGLIAEAVVFIEGYGICAALKPFYFFGDIPFGWLVIKAGMRVIIEPLFADFGGVIGAVREGMFEGVGDPKSRVDHVFKVGEAFITNNSGLSPSLIFW